MKISSPPATSGSAPIKSASVKNDGLEFVRVRDKIFEFCQALFDFARIRCGERVACRFVEPP